MGLIANYSCLSDANLKEIKAMGSEEEEILESVEEWNDDKALKSGMTMMNYCLISIKCGMYFTLC